MNLIKVYDKTCDVCQMLAGIDEQIAEDNDLFFRQATLEEVAKNPSSHRDYIIANYVNPEDGMVDIPIYLVTSTQGEVLASGIVKTVEELTNLIEALRTWESSANAKSAV